MYREFYGLEEKPFALLPDTRFVYLGTSHREALAHLLYGIEAGEGFIELIGQVGTGKTTLCRTLLDRFGTDVTVAFIFNPSQSEVELLQSIHREYGLNAEGKGRAQLVDELNEFLLKTRAEGRRAVVVVDEAQNLPRDVLEQLRLLSNLETEREKLVQMVLIGQPELDENLAQPDLRQLRQRITVRWCIRPFDRPETEDYVSHRLRVAGRRRGRPLFTRGALHAIHRASKGIPRLINAIADRTLLAGYAARREQINARIVRRAVREMMVQPPRLRWLRVALFTAAALLGLAALVWGGVHERLLRSFAVAPVSAPAAIAGYSAVATAPEAELLRLQPALLKRPVQESAADALGRVLKLWGISAKIPERIEPTRMGAVLKDASNLRLSSDFTTLEELRRLDQPVILELEPKPGEVRYVVLQTLLEGELAGVSAGDQLFVLGVGALKRFWNGRALFVWRNFESWPVFERGDGRPAVRELQASLTRLGYMNPGDPSGAFDEPTELAIRKFQEGQGLPPTGQLGFKTMIALYRSLDDWGMREEKRPPYGGPRLERTARSRS